jgi:hypothetical protein
MYAALRVGTCFNFNGIPAALKRKIIEPKRISDKPFGFFSFLFMWKYCTKMRRKKYFKLLLLALENSRVFSVGHLLTVLYISE